MSAEEIPGYLRALRSPDLYLDPPNPNILYTHRQLEGRDLYFIINSAPAPTVLWPQLRTEGPYSLYRPRDGSVQDVGHTLNLGLAGYEGVFVVCQP